MGLQFDDKLSRLDTIPACDRQTDRRPTYIKNVYKIKTDTLLKMLNVFVRASIHSIWGKRNLIQILTQ